MASNTKEVAGHAAEASSAGLPQLDFSTFANQIFWLLLALLAVFFILSRIALPRIEEILSDRQDAITDDLAEAEELNKRAKAAEENYEQALITARSNAAAIIKETKDQIDADLSDAIAKADAEIAKKADEAEAQIAQIKASAVEGVRKVAQDIAGEIAGTVGANVSADALAKSIQDQLKGS